MTKLLCLLVTLCYFMYNAQGLGLDCTRSTCQLNDNTVRFFVIGDWGGDKKGPTTTGQVNCANLMSDMGLDKQPHFFISTGDNFYEDGVQNAQDPRFQTTFDDVFLYGKQQQVPWYMTMGNHDWTGNASAQIEYTKYNSRWVLPDYAFTASYDASSKGGPSVDTIYIDTIVLCGNVEDEPEEDESSEAVSGESDAGQGSSAQGSSAQGFSGEGSSGEGFSGESESGERFKRKVKVYPGPANPAQAEQVWQYIENQMAKSTADYLFVVGHYPLFSATSYNISSCLVPRLQNLLDQYKGNAYMCGHAHNLQHTTTVGQSSGRTIHHILSGAGHLTSDHYKKVLNQLGPNPWSPENLFFYPQKGSQTKKQLKKDSGMNYVQLGKQSGTVEYYSCDGTLLYSFDITARTSN